MSLSFAEQLFADATARVAADAAATAREIFSTMRTEVMAGQYLDIHAEVAAQTLPPDKAIERAFEVLAWQSQETNIKVRDLARRLIAELRTVEMSPATRAAAIVDPVLDFDPRSGRTGLASAAPVLERAAADGLRIDWLLETHAHADHLTAAAHLRAAGCRSRWSLRSGGLLRVLVGRQRGGGLLWA